MIVSYPYIIRPTIELINLVQEKYLDINPRDTYTRSVVWENSGDYLTDDEELIQDLIQRAKISFLSRLGSVNLYNMNKESSQINHQLVSFYQDLFGSPPLISTKTFDRWWTIERLEPGGDFEKQILKSASDETLNWMIQFGDTFVKAYLTAMLEYREVRNRIEKE